MSLVGCLINNTVSVNLNVWPLLPRCAGLLYVICDKEPALLRLRCGRLTWPQPLTYLALLTGEPLGERDRARGTCHIWMGC